jgi:transcriptional regulator with PAS, ATPase and Fis domain
MRLTIGQYLQLGAEHYPVMDYIYPNVFTFYESEAIKRGLKKLAEKLSVLEDKVEFYEKELLSLRSTRYTINSIVGASSIIKTLKKETAKAATNNLPVLVAGESGTGKEFFAQAIHHGSKRKMYPFM